MPLTLKQDVDSIQTRFLSDKCSLTALQTGPNSQLMREAAINTSGISYILYNQLVSILFFRF